MATRVVQKVCGGIRQSGAVAAGIATALAFGCASPDGTRRQLEERALTLSVTELQMHLRTDSYHSFAHLDERGRNVFAVALWRLERLAEQRAERRAEGAAFTAFVLEDEDIVIEFARARALARMQRYREAGDAYGRVAQLDGLLAEPAAQEQRFMQLFAALAEAAAAVPAEQRTLEQIEAWADEWHHLADALGDSPHAAAARLESEVWEQARVEHLAARGRNPEAIRACARLLNRHRESKLYPRHLIRLGDLHAETARLEHLRSRTERRSLDIGRYERSIERAFSAYELASETRKSVLRREARSKIEALLAYHEGVRNDVQ